MSDLKLTFYADDLIEGTEEHDLFISVTEGNREFQVLGCSYAVTDIVFERFSGDQILSASRNKITIKATKLIPAHFPPEKEPAPGEKDSESRYGIYNALEDRWEYDHQGNVFVFKRSDLGIAGAQCQALWHDYNRFGSGYRDGQKIDTVMEIRKYCIPPRQE